MTELQQWADNQIKSLVALGVDAVDAEQSVKWALDNLQDGVEPDAWVPTAKQLEERIDDSDVHDARVAWYASDSVPSKFKRLLDARGGAMSKNDLDSIAKDHGFESAGEMNRLVAGVDISTAEKFSAFERWRLEDGRKAGLLLLIESTAENDHE